MDDDELEEALDILIGLSQGNIIVLVALIKEHRPLMEAFKGRDKRGWHKAPRYGRKKEQVSNEPVRN